MKSFILEVLEDLKNKNEDLSKYIFILPSKRAGFFLKRELTTITTKTIFSPVIITIEEFIEKLAGITTINNTQSLFELYNTYLKLTPNNEKETFENFSKWAQILLQDFNEIDRFLISQDKLFNYLKAIKSIENWHWSQEENQTLFIKKYLKFWNNIAAYYNNFTTCLIDKNYGYQGLVYRKAAENADKYIKKNPSKKYVFLGFNALNIAEVFIFQKLINNNQATVYWDIDKTFFDNPIHDAALFTRQYKTTWNYYKNNDFKWITNSYQEKKNINIYGISKNIGQAKQIGLILKKSAEKNPTFKNTAVVLGDEKLLNPVLNSLPENINSINITMGFQLKLTPLASLFEQLFSLQKKQSKTYYYKDIIGIISHQYISPLLKIENVNYATHIIETIQKNNLIYLTLNDIKQLIKKDLDIIDLLFTAWSNTTKTAIEYCFKIILKIKECLSLEKEQNHLALETLFRFNTLFNELLSLNQRYKHIKSISSLYSIYKELLVSETLDFQGNPSQGLQIMGMLETRVLDFETVIISNVNEGILPSGKTNNSFIPFDVKLENNLPTYKEKDAIYTYHFYRLLQRAKNIYILYNTEADVLNGGEKSRFISQLEYENIHNINHKIVVPQLPSTSIKLKEIKKTEAVISELKVVAQKGFSPSSLTNYIRNPIDFYYQKLLGIKNSEEVEETVAANTLGTVVHNSLEVLYKPFVSKHLSIKNIESMIPKIKSTVTHFFNQIYKDGDISKGKNLIVFEIAQRYLLNFLNLEITALKQGNSIKIIALEKQVNTTLKLPELNFKVNINGTVDRIDEYNGVIRVIDYKTGKVLPSEVSITDWENITKDYKKHSKSFQILTYAYILNQEKAFSLPIEAGVISFKNLQSGFLKFTKREQIRGGKTTTAITQDILDSYYKELKKLILEIFNSEINFIEKIIAK